MLLIISLISGEFQVGVTVTSVTTPSRNASGVYVLDDSEDDQLWIEHSEWLRSTYR